MIGRILCLLGIHKFEPRDLWFPSMHARFVEQYSCWAHCQRCGVDDRYSEYDFRREKAVRDKIASGGKITPLEFEELFSSMLMNEKGKPQ